MKRKNKAKQRKLITGSHRHTNAQIFSEQYPPWKQKMSPFSYFNLVFIAKHDVM